MATKIIHKKSSVASSAPVAADIVPGELALNLADQKIYSKQTDGTIIEMANDSSDKLPLSGGTMTGDIDLGYDDKVTFGDSGELEIYHGAAGNSHITHTGTGDFRIRTTTNDKDIVIQAENGAGGVENYIRADGSARNVQLSSEGAVKFSTAATGVDVSGNVTVTGTVDGRDVAADGTKLDTIETSATADQTDAEIRAAVEAATDSNVFTDADHTKLNGIEASANNYSHPANHAISVITGLQTALDGKVDDSQVLTNVPSGALFTDTNTVYTHPTHPGDDAAIDTGALTGATVISDLDLNITTDTLGHVTDANATVATRTLTLANLGYTGATNANNSTSNATHTGEVTGSGALTVADNVIDAGNLKVTGNGSTSQYLRSDGDGTFTWATPTDTNTNTTYSAGAGLDLSGTTFSVESDLRSEVFYMGRDTNDYFGVETTQMNWVLDGNTDMRLENDGDLHVDGNVVAYSTTTSDERLKKDIVKIDNALDKVSQLNGYTFEYLNDGKKSAGILAQEVEAVLPSAVTEMKLPLKSDDDQEYKVVQYDQLHGLLIEAIKELKAEIEVLKGN